ncbi:hypothetical protein NECAME_19045 [Necator americanus]|uniref:Uncharacterized protein n=1 Tax=Necator americanus TaxID=51031 RepID=W2SQX6_NECAM|nr:hypothetical protein NECAME_19045 [Necator americanus]ETN72040.1 hypothetical protein NECAME_19045 [Necator americanus]
MFKLGLSLSVLIFLFMLEAHHYTPLMSARQLYITYLSTAICLDLVDNIYFLDLLWQSFPCFHQVNGPFLGLRIYLYVLLEVEQKGRHYDFSLFAVKNVAVIYLALRELWTRLQYWRMKRRATGSRGELTAQHNVDEDH